MERLSNPDAAQGSVSPKAVLLTSIPGLLGAAASTVKGYREKFIDPGVSVHDKSDSKSRSKFDDNQLQKLLRGFKVEEVKQHSIK
jgi:hypothetical protein